MADEEFNELRHKSIRRIICMYTKITKNHDSNSSGVTVTQSQNLQEIQGSDSGVG